MKKTLVIAMTALISVAAMAQEKKSFDTDYFQKMNARAAMDKQFKMRKAPKMDNAAIMQHATKGGTKSANQLGTSAMPANRWFPGEWEEVQAIVVNFPYIAYPADHMGDDDYQAAMSTPGYGTLYHYNSQSGWQNMGSGAVDGIPDTTDYMATLQEAVAYYSQYLSNPTYASRAQQYIDQATSYYTGQENFRSVFTNLIDAIQHGSQVWITIWHLSDSTIIKDFMAGIGKPLTNYRFIEAYANAFWYRDCGPICFYYGDNDDVAILNFDYGGRYCDDLLPDSIASQTGMPNYVTNLSWEGGNCMVDGMGNLFTSDALYDENGTLPNSAVKDSMDRFFGYTYVLPRLQYEGGTGHVDLYADMLDENQFVFSKFPSQYSGWTDYTIAAKNIDSLTSWQNAFGNNYKKAHIPFPRKDDGSYFTSETEYWNPIQQTGYTRSYSNHTLVNDIIVQPCFSEVVNGNPTAEWEIEFFDSIRAAYPGYTIYPINVSSFDGYGGAIHCITKQIPAENPIRILHPSITGATGDLYRNQNARIEATITNRSGIANATLYYQENDGTWQTVAMQHTSGDTYVAEIPTSQMQGDFTVRYYIRATSNNGKSINKPYTATSGGAYKFNAGEQVGIDAVASEERFGQFYPNPATDQAHLNISLGAGQHYSVVIMDIAGRTVHTSSLQAQGDIIYTVNASRLQSGIYHVVFSNGNEQIVRRLIVK